MTPAPYATTISFGASLPDVDLTKYATFSPFSGPLLAKDDARFFAPRIAFTVEFQPSDMCITGLHRVSALIHFYRMTLNKLEWAEG
jgi:hypothetical protein